MKRTLGIALLTLIGVTSFAISGTQWNENRSNSVVASTTPILPEEPESHSSVGVVGLFAVSMIAASKIRKEKV